MSFTCVMRDVERHVPLLLFASLLPALPCWCLFILSYFYIWIDISFLHSFLFIVSTAALYLKSCSYWIMFEFFFMPNSFTDTLLALHTLNLSTCISFGSQLVDSVISLIKLNKNFARLEIKYSRFTFCYFFNWLLHDSCMRILFGRTSSLA